MKHNLRQLSKEEIDDVVSRYGQKRYRTEQIIDWLYKKDASSIDEMTDLSKDFRDGLKKTAYLSNLKIIKVEISADGTEKYLFELEDGETIESVLMPGSRGKNQYTICISTQVGCAMDCKFCVTGGIGYRRNLKFYEIIDQIISVRRELQKKTDRDHPVITNIVFMGMGEPLLNFDETVEALSRLTAHMGFSKRKITVSTSGIVPKIPALAIKAPGVTLAVSLNATTDRTRSRLMPVNKKYPLKELINACRRFRLPPNRRITFEYVMLDRINDSIDDAYRLVKLLNGIKCKVNLIPYNSSGIIVSDSSRVLSDQTEVELTSPTMKKIIEFQNILKDEGIKATIRKSKGSDISAACGQLGSKFLSPGAPA